MSALRSDSTMMRVPCSMASDACWQIRSSADRSPSPPSATRYSPESTLACRPGRVPSSLMWMILASSSLSMIGNGSDSWRQLSGPGSSRLASGPTDDDTAVTTSSRIASSGGLVTCAKSCLK